MHAHAHPRVHTRRHTQTRAPVKYERPPRDPAQAVFYPSSQFPPRVARGLLRGTKGRGCRSERERGFAGWGGMARKRREKGDEREERSEARVGWHFYWSLGIRCPTTAGIRAPFPSLPPSLTLEFHRSFPSLGCGSGPGVTPPRGSESSTLARQISLASRTTSSQPEPLFRTFLRSIFTKETTRRLFLKTPGPTRERSSLWRAATYRLSNSNCEHSNSASISTNYVTQCRWSIQIIE